jgi:AraC family transcriptional activator of pobA
MQFVLLLKKEMILMEYVDIMKYSKIYGVIIEEIFGDCLINIEFGSFSIQNKSQPTNWLHYHNFYELSIVTEGSGEFIHGNDNYILSEGVVFVANPGVLHEIRLKKDNNSMYIGKLCFVYFRIKLQFDSNHKTKPKLYEEIILKNFLSSHTIVSKSQKHIFNYLHFIENYVELGSIGNFGLHQAIKNMALESLFSLVNSKSSQYNISDFKSDIINQAIMYINANLNRKIYLKEIAINSNTSIRNLQYIFKNNFKKNITDYINIRKTSVAAGYLKMNFTIKDVSNNIGINDLAQFSRLFKKYYGISPKKYQIINTSTEIYPGTIFKSDDNL